MQLVYYDHTYLPDPHLQFFAHTLQYISKLIIQPLFLFHVRSVVF